jgi:hypothetical protein
MSLSILPTGSFFSCNCRLIDAAGIIECQDEQILDLRKWRLKGWAGGKDYQLQSRSGTGRHNDRADDFFKER